MAKVVIRLSDEVQKRIGGLARLEGVCLSDWVEEKLSRALGGSRWPPGYFKLFGSVDEERFEVVDDAWGGLMASKVRPGTTLLG